MVLRFLSFAVSPGTWPGGAWVPGGPRPGFCCLLILHQDVSHVSLAKWASPQFENHVQILIFHLPMMNLQDQVTLTNWPASKKKDRILAHLVQVISEWIVSSIEPAKEMTRSKEPEFMFLHTKGFWFRLIWIDLHQSLTIDWASSRDRAPVGLVRCVCKDDQIKGPNAPVKFKLSNIHAFVPIWMAPSILKNFRLIAEQSSFLSDLGRLDYRKGWFAMTGETLCGLQVHLSDDNLVEFSHCGWPAIEVWAERGLLKPDAWRSRRTNLSIKAKVEIPVSGTAIQIQQQALKFDQIPDSWPCDLESGWAAHYGRLDMKFMDMCQHLVQNQFVSDAFQDGPDSYLFQWGSNEFMECQFDHRDPTRAQGVVPAALAHRLAQASQMRGAYAHIVHDISRNFTMKDTNLFMDHLIRRCKGNLIPYVEDRQLLLDHSVNIVQELGLSMLAERQVVED